MIGIGRILVKSGRYAEAVPLLTFRAGIEENPYLEVPVAGLEQIPSDEWWPVTSARSIWTLR